MTDPRALEDRQAITDLLYRYCRSVDRIDVPLGHSLWHDDGTADYGADYYQGPGRGVIDRICADHRRLLAHSHQVTNILIELDGDRAGSEAYCTATLRMEREGRPVQMSVWSRYVDRWSRRDGRWGIDHRIAIRDFDEIRAVQPMGERDMGRRDAADPSYAALRGEPA
ncbi:MAG: nuclear transport factor 2 family protein [Sphingobium sp.]